MSQWTHVNGVIRIDAIRLPGMPNPMNKPEDVLGHMTPDHLPMNVSKTELERHRQDWNRCNIPAGSEGSIQWQLYDNPMKEAMAAYTVMFWGDLRDFGQEDTPKIVEYFKRVTTKAGAIRNGVFQIEVEFGNFYTWSYRNDEWVLIDTFDSGEGDD